MQVQGQADSQSESLCKFASLFVKNELMCMGVWPAHVSLPHVWLVKPDEDMDLLALELYTVVCPEVGAGNSPRSSGKHGQCS